VGICFKDPVPAGISSRRGLEKNNYDLQLAAGHALKQERALPSVSAVSQYYPQVGYGASISGQQALTNSKSHVLTHTVFQRPLGRIDLFGRHPGKLKTKGAACGVFFPLRKHAEDVAGSWSCQTWRKGTFQLRALDEQLEIGPSNCKKLWRKRLTCFQRKFEGGAASGT